MPWKVMQNFRGCRIEKLACTFTVEESSRKHPLKYSWGEEREDKYVSEWKRGGEEYSSTQFQEQ